MSTLQYQSSKKAGFRALLPTRNETLDEQRKAVKKLLKVSGGTVRVTNANRSWTDYRLVNGQGTAAAATGNTPASVVINGVRYVPAR
jgi:hypothetical protein